MRGGSIGKAWDKVIWWVVDVLTLHNSIPLADIPYGCLEALSGHGICTQRCPILTQCACMFLVRLHVSASLSALTSDGVRMPTISSQEVVLSTTYGTASDDIIGAMATFGFQCGLEKMSPVIKYLSWFIAILLMLNYFATQCNVYFSCKQTADRYLPFLYIVCRSRLIYGDYSRFNWLCLCLSTHINVNKCI